MPETVLYGVITFLGLVVVTLGGIWVRSHDRRMEWASEKIAEHERMLSVSSVTAEVIRTDIKEIKNVLKDHMDLEMKVQRALIAKLNLKIEE
jgi:exosome complex RNA-binding protein Rrp4